MVEMQVGEDDVIDGFRSESANIERRQRLRHDFEIRRVDEGGATLAF